MTDPSPRADFCWEGRLACVIVLLWLLYFFTILRFKALRGTRYAPFSPRGIAGGCILSAVALCTVYAVLFIWNYSTWYRIRGYQELSRRTRDDDLLDLINNMVPEYRKGVSFAMRMLLVTVLWLVKFSFLVIYYEFPQHLPKRVRFLLHFTTAFILTTYVVVWVVTGTDWEEALKREEYSPSAGAGVTLYTPMNSWSQYMGGRGTLEFDGIPSILRAEFVITTLNAATDILLLILVYTIFQHLSLSSGRTQFRAASLLCALFVMAVILALIRLVLLCVSMRGMYSRLAFDTLTDFEAFLSGCAASIPAVRVLVRDYSSTGTTNTLVDSHRETFDSSNSVAKQKQKLTVEFPEKWGTLFDPKKEEGSNRDIENEWENNTYTSITSANRESGWPGQPKSPAHPPQETAVPLGSVDNSRGGLRNSWSSW